MNYTINQFNDVFPMWETVSLENLTSQLIDVITLFKDKPKSALKIEIPHDKAAAIIHVKNAGFKLYSADDNKTNWVLKKEAMMPEVFNAYGGVQVYPIKNNKILVMEEKFKQGLVTFVAGQVNSHEFPRDAAVRELHEELNIKVNPDKLKLFASRIRMKANKEGATNYDYFFVINEFDESELKPNPEEVLQVFWVELDELKNNKTITSPDGKVLKTSPMVPLIAEHLLSNLNTHFEKIPDCRQWNKERVDPNDNLHLEFFKQ
jgi:8-oxo-dGTP pyrophosphatase MutT (NUDIX family)